MERLIEYYCLNVLSVNSLYAELKEKCSSLESKWNDQFLSIPQRVINSASVCLLKEYNCSLLSS